MLRSLRYRLLFAMIAVAVTAVAALAIIASLAAASRFRHYVAEGGIERDRRFATALEQRYRENEAWGDLQTFVDQVARLSGERIVVADLDGQVLADSSHSLVSQPVPEAASRPQPPLPITVNGLPVGFLYVGLPDRLPRDPVNPSFIDSVNQSLVLATGVASLAAVFLTVVISRRIVRPVEALTDAVRRMGTGDLSQRVRVQSDDEIGELGRAFNGMAESLSHHEQLRQNLVSDVAHELRTPLSGLFGYIEAIEDGVLQPSADVVGAMHSEAAQLGRLVDDLQDLSLVESGHLTLDRQPVALEGVVAAAIGSSNQAAAAKGIMLDCDIPQSLPKVLVDRDRIAQVLRNLLSNAIKYTDSGGRVTVSVAAEDGFLAVEVSDTGIGIAPDHLTHVFDRFYRADPSRSRDTGGSGLGLAIAKQLVEAHGGTIAAESTPGEGSTFRCTLPLAPPDGE